MKYDYFIAGRWRSHDVIRPVLEAIRNAGKTAYCFIDNAYDSDDIMIDTDKNADAEAFMSQLETISDWKTNPTFRKIFENDMRGLKESKEFILVFPAGFSAHMELGAAYGMGKKCYGIGKPDKYETLYLMFDEIFPNVDGFLNAKTEARV